MFDGTAGPVDYVDLATMPTNFIDVPASLYVLDSNNNYRLIGTFTTDASGTYSLTWTPDVSGNYTVFANFVGTNGYWPSSAESHITVDQPSATASPQPIAAQPPTGMYITEATVAIIIAIIIAIAIVGAVITVALRKRA